jgi:hypothetical protein
VTPDEARASYDRMMNGVGETVTIRRYSGTGGSRTYTDYAARARVMEFQPSELVGNLTQGARKLIVIARDLETAGFTFPLLPNGNDKIRVRGKEMTVQAVDDNTRRVQGVLIALDVVVNG